jgi:hypothetical protein
MVTGTAASALIIVIISKDLFNYGHVVAMTIPTERAATAESLPVAWRRV